MLITGASSGIGRELAFLAAQRGAKLLLTARRTERLQEVADQILKSTSSAATDCLVLAGDVTEPAHREALADRCQDDWEGLDVLVNNAGVGAIGRFSDASSQQLRQIMEVNFFAPVELTRLLLPLLAEPSKEHRSAIAIVGSVLALSAVPLKSEYCASKFALHGWAESLRSELRDHGIDVLELHPSTTESEFFDHAMGDPSLQKSIGAMSPRAAAEHVLKGIERGRPETVFPTSGKALVALRRWSPALYRLIMKRSLDS